MLLEAFKVYDKDDNGLIPMNDLRSVFTTLGEPLGYDQVGTIVCVCVHVCVFGVVFIVVKPTYNAVRSKYIDNIAYTTCVHLFVTLHHNCFHCYLDIVPSHLISYLSIYLYQSIT